MGRYAFFGWCCCIHCCVCLLVHNPRIDTRAAFEFRAPVEVWRRKFLSAKPPPLYHDFFAMLMRVPEFVIEGLGAGI
jgi:hypothetical protein